jgi:hypothetical protein
MAACTSNHSQATSSATTGTTPPATSAANTTLPQTPTTTALAMTESDCAAAVQPAIQQLASSAVSTEQQWVSDFTTALQQNPSSDTGMYSEELQSDQQLMAQNVVGWSDLAANICGGTDPARGLSCVNLAEQSQILSDVKLEQQTQDGRLAQYSAEMRQAMSGMSPQFQQLYAVSTPGLAATAAIKTSSNELSVFSGCVATGEQ